ncbi:MAG: hypothetical protein WB919_00485 [Candidatus Sulfotelmatobacter sp.]
MDNVPRCRHIKVNGIQCGSPALRRRRHCYFHERVREQHARIMDSQFRQARFVVPVLEDANSVQMALMQVMQMLATGQMDHKTAGLMLYALQTASANLRDTEFEAEEATDVVIDRNDVHRTAIDGPQWFEEDFDEDEGDEEENAEEGGEVVEEGKGEVVAETAAVEEHVSIEEARNQIRGTLESWLLAKAEARVGSAPG